MTENSKKKRAPNTRQKPSPELPESTILKMADKLCQSGEVNSEALGKVLDMYQYTQEQNKEKLFNVGLAQLQADLPTIGKDGAILNKQGNVASKYSTYEDIMKAIQPLLTLHGFAFNTKPTHKADQVIVTGVLRHEGGYSDTSTLPLPLDLSGFKNQVQGVGSSLSYGKRYLLIMMLNINTGEHDDDGQGATPDKNSSVKIVTAKQVKELIHAISATGKTVESFCAQVRIDDIKDLEASRFKGAMAFLRENKAETS